MDYCSTLKNFDKSFKSDQSVRCVYVCRRQKEEGRCLVLAQVFIERM